jgi:hypothetical protein
MSGVFQNIDLPPPHRPASVYPPRLWCGGKTHSLGGEGGVNILEDGRHCSVLYICKYFVTHPLEGGLPLLQPAPHNLLRLTGCLVYGNSVMDPRPSYGMSILGSEKSELKKELITCRA